MLFRSPALEPRGEVLVTAGARLMGQWLLLIGVASYGRFVVLDAQGLIPVRQRKRAVSRPVKKSTDSDVREVAATTSSASPSSPLRAFRQSLTSTARPAAAEPKSTQWIDGSELERDSYDDDEPSEAGGRKLSKAERKRLRKLKAQGRAA